MTVELDRFNDNAVAEDDPVARVFTVFTVTCGSSAVSLVQVASALFSSLAGVA